VIAEHSGADKFRVAENVTKTNNSFSCDMNSRRSAGVVVKTADRFRCDSVESLGTVAKTADGFSWDSAKSLGKIVKTTDSFSCNGISLGDLEESGTSVSVEKAHTSSVGAAGDRSMNKE